MPERKCTVCHLPVAERDDDGFMYIVRGRCYRRQSDWPSKTWHTDDTNGYAAACYRRGFNRLKRDLRGGGDGHG